MLHKANTEFREGWRILLIALLGVVTSPHYLGLYSFGPLVPDLTEALDIPIGELQRAITFNFIGIAIGSQLGGWLLIRFEPKTVTLCSLLLFSALYAVLSFIEITRNTLYFFYLVLPLVGSGALLVTWTQLACLHFEKKRGIALAIVLSGGGVISAVAPLLLSTLTGTEHWQLAFLLLALLPLTTFFICLFALPKSNSSELANSVSQQSKTAKGLDFKQVLYSWRFWVIVFASVLVIIVVLSLITNIVPMLVEKGLSHTKASLIYSVFGLSLITGRLVGGFLIDRIWGPLVAFCVMVLPAFGCLIYLFAPAQVLPMIIATIMVGFAAGAEYAIRPGTGSSNDNRHHHGGFCRRCGVRHYGVSRISLFRTESLLKNLWCTHCSNHAWQWYGTTNLWPYS